MSVTSKGAKVCATRTEINLHRNSSGQVLGQVITFYNAIYPADFPMLAGSQLPATGIGSEEIPADCIVPLAGGEVTVDLVKLYESDKHKAMLVGIGLEIDGFVLPKPIEPTQAVTNEPSI